MPISIDVSVQQRKQAADDDPSGVSARMRRIAAAALAVQILPRYTLFVLGASVLCGLGLLLGAAPLADSEGVTLSPVAIVLGLAVSVLIGFQIGRRRSAPASDATERARTEEQVAFQANALAQVNDAVVAVDLGGHILYWNLAAERLYGYQAQEVLGRRLPDVTRPVTPSEQSAQRKFWSKLAAQNTARTVVTHRTKTGEEIIVETSTSVLTGPDDEQHGILAVLRDVTARVRAEEDLERQKERLKLITDTIGEVFWLADVKVQKMLYISPGYDRIWGRSREDLYENPRTFVSAVHPADQESVRSNLAAQKQGEPFELEYRIVRPDGSVRWIWDRGYPVREEDGEVFRYVGVAQDITERKQLQAQLLQSQKMEAVGRLAGGVAHDFNNQLFVINGYTELLAQRLAGDRSLAAQIAEIRNAGERAANLTKQLLTYSRKQVVAPKVIDLNDELRALEQMLRRLIGEDIALGLSLEPELGKVKIDPVQLQQIVMNLVVNARDAMPDGGRLVIATANAEVGPAVGEVQSRTGRWVVLRVADSGMGMTQETIAHIFEPFFTTKEQGKGTGLGLATVHAIVTQSGGSIEVSSERGAGTTFEIHLPRVDAPPAAERSVAATVNHVRGEGKLILLAEDETAVRSLLAEALRQRGFRVVEAADGVEALACAETLGGEIDLLITDMIMPRMNGRDLTRRLAPLFPRMRIVFLSGYTDVVPVQEDILPIREWLFLHKPCPLDVLFEAIRELLEE